MDNEKKARSGGVYRRKHMSVLACWVFRTALVGWGSSLWYEAGASAASRQLNSAVQVRRLFQKGAHSPFGIVHNP